MKRVSARAEPRPQVQLSHTKVKVRGLKKRSINFIIQLISSIYKGSR
jgi:hypothetical protein